MKASTVLLIGASLTMVALTSSAPAEWQRTPTTLAWHSGPQVVWQFSFDPAKGKTFFNPLSVEGGPSLTNFRPEDHPWHYGLWFSWKYINDVNYWEEDRQTGKPEGATRWTTPEIETHPDGSALIRYTLSYVHPTGRVDLTEQRELEVSAPGPYGNYSIDWRAKFTAGDAGAVLARTPMPGEPNGQVNGGYAGLGIRLPSAPATVAFVTTDGPVSEFVSDRARPAAPAIACNVSEGGQVVGSLAILSHPTNAGERAPWYLVNGQMRFACAAVLAPKVRTLPPGSNSALRYRIIVAPSEWTAERLASTYAAWRR